MRFIMSEFSIPFCIFPGGVTGGRVFGAGVDTVPRKQFGRGVVFGYSDGGSARRSDSHAGHISRGRPENAIYADGGASDPRLLFPD